MADIQLLNKEDHRDLRVKTERSPELGDGVMSCQTFPGEFRDSQAHYPILFQKQPDTDRFLAVVLFGLEKSENLFLSEGRWQSYYIPLMLQREPFSIGLGSETDDQGERRRVVNVDISSPRLSREEGILLFEPHGAQTPYLDKVAGILETLYHWHEQSDCFIDYLLEYELLEPVTFDLTLNSGRQGQLVGFHTINEDRLAKLPEQQLRTLHQSNYLPAVYMAMASLSNIRRLIDLKSNKERAVS